jgi:hypothetical protein
MKRRQQASNTSCDSMRTPATGADGTSPAQAAAAGERCGGARRLLLLDACVLA